MPEYFWWVVGLAGYLTLGNFIWKSQYDHILAGNYDPTYMFIMRVVTTLFWLMAVVWVLTHKRAK